MANNIPFQAQGKTYKANVTVTSQTITITADSPCNQLLVSNHQPTGSGGQPVYFLVSSNASITATVPTTLTTTSNTQLITLQYNQQDLSTNSNVVRLLTAV